MLTVALFRKAYKWQQFKYPPIDEWREKNIVESYNGYYSSLIRNEERAKNKGHIWYDHLYEMPGQTIA